MRSLKWLPVIALFALFIGCSRPREFMDVWPAEKTQAAAKLIEPSQVRVLRLFVREGHNLPREINVSNPQIVKQLLLGLSQAQETGLLNQVCKVEVIGTRSQVLLTKTFALSGPTHALSPEFIVGLKQAGVVLPWEEEARRQAEQQKKWRIVLISSGGILLLGVLPLWIVARRRRSHRST
jgi:hypothetical protein